MSGLGIDRCFCFAQPFAGLKAVAEATGARTVGELCALCHPYVRRTLRTGETVFDQIVTEADEPGPERPAG